MTKKQEEESIKDLIRNYKFDNGLTEIGGAKKLWRKVKTTMKFGGFKTYKHTDIEEKRKKKSWKFPLIDPESFLGFFIYITVNIAFTISFFLIPFILATNEGELDRYQIVDLVVDFILVFDIILAFFTKVGGETRIGRIWIRYLLTYFVFDIISVFPALFSWEAYYYLYWLKICRYLKLGRYFSSINQIL